MGKEEANKNVATIINLYRHNLKPKEIADAIGLSSQYVSTILCVMKKVVEGDAAGLKIYKQSYITSVCEALGMEAPKEATPQEPPKNKQCADNEPEYAERLDEIDAKLGDITRVLCDMHECLRRMLEVWKNG